MTAEETELRALESSVDESDIPADDNFADDVQAYSKEMRIVARAILQEARSHIPHIFQRTASKSEPYQRSERARFLGVVRNSIDHGSLVGGLQAETRIALAVMAFQVAWKEVVEARRWTSHPSPDFQKNLPPVPTMPVAIFFGGSDSAPLDFVLAHYGLWIDARMIDLTYLDSLHSGIAQKIHNEIRANKRANSRDGGNRLESVTDIFPTKAEAARARETFATAQKIREMLEPELE